MRQPHPVIFNFLIPTLPPPKSQPCQSKSNINQPFRPNIYNTIEKMHLLSFLAALLLSSIYPYQVIAAPVLSLEDQRCDCLMRCSGINPEIGGPDFHLCSMYLLVFVCLFVHRLS